MPEIFGKRDQEVKAPAGVVGIVQNKENFARDRKLLAQGGQQQDETDEVNLRNVEEELGGDDNERPLMLKTNRERLLGESRYKKMLRRIFPNMDERSLSRMEKRHEQFRDSAEGEEDLEVIRYKTALEKLLKKQGYQLTAIATFDKDTISGVVSIAIQKGNSIEVPLSPNLNFSVDDLESLLAKFDNKDEWAPGLDDHSIRALVNLGLIEKINTER